MDASDARDPSQRPAEGDRSGIAARPGTQRSLPIGIREVSKRYGKTVALDHVSIDVAAGEFITLLGPSGSGKTTLLMVLAGFVRPDSGAVFFGPKEVTFAPSHQRNVGMVFQNYALFPHMTVLENLLFPLRVRRIPRAEAMARARRALDLVHLGGLEERRIDQLSGGQQQRVALGRAIVFEPPILLMDEPLSALDKKLREAMQVEIRRLQRGLGTTTVYVTHDQREALSMSDRIAVIDGGRILQLDTPDRVYNRPASLFVADFIGDSAFVPVEVAHGRAMFDGVPLRLSESRVFGPGAHVLVLRPEKLELLSERPPDGWNLLEGVVKERVFLGDTISLAVFVAGGTEIMVKAHARQAMMESAPSPGDRVRLGLHPTDTLVLPRDSVLPTDGVLPRDGGSGPPRAASP